MNDNVYEPAALATLADLTDKVAIVTGSGRGLGYDIANRLSEAGAAVVINDIDDDLALSAAAKLVDLGRRATAVPGSVMDPEVAERMLAGAALWGQVDILVNNAAALEWATFFDLTKDHWDRVLDVNLYGPLVTMQAVAKQMIEHGRRGSIVNVLSTACITVLADDLVAYSASKAGLRQASLVIAKLLAPHGIRVNHILPGAMETPGNTKSRVSSMPLAPGRRLYPDEVARLVYVLVTDLAEMVAGAEIVVDGGGSMG
jgi:NAD(P)-dependent dehydrogenase (short-subunit alcohol dehydrogenase family)